MRRPPLPARLLAACAVAAMTACMGADDSAMSPAGPSDAALATGSDPAAPALPPPPMPVEPPPQRMPGSGDGIERCNAEAAREVIGREATADLVEEARSAAGADRVRTLKPGQMVTMEYHASRLTLDVDEDNIVVDVRCG